MLRLNVDTLRRKIADCDGFRTVGKLRSARGLITASVPAALGELCHIRLDSDRALLAEVIGFDGDLVQILSFHRNEGLRPGQNVVALGRPHRVPVGTELLGRVLNALGAPLDGRGPLHNRRWRMSGDQSPAALQRPRIDTPFVTGQRVIDGMLTCGRGQRIGLFAGSGVGKSTLLGEIAKGATSDINVICLVGERGREVRPFLEDNLGPQGLQRSIVVVSTSDDTPLMRVRAVSTAITIADEFRARGQNVLLLLDSLTRLAMAQREIGLLRGEPPSARGYTPSVFQLLAETLERLGNSEHGSITGILTVLVDGDDMDEPIADAARAILDGHVVLSRSLAAKGHYPAVDVGASISRVFREVTDARHHAAARKLRAILATYTEVADLIQIGAYQSGSSPNIDRAIQLYPIANTFLRQETGSPCPFSESVDSLVQIAEAWNF